MIESGLPGFIASSWTGIMAPAGTPKDIIGRLNAEVNAALKSPEMQDRFKKLAAEANPRHARGLRGIHRAGGSEMAGDGQARRRNRANEQAASKATMARSGACSAGCDCSRQSWRRRSLSPQPRRRNPIRTGRSS